MSGYLERLTRGVKEPGGSLRPVIGSIFAPAVAESGLEFGATREEGSSQANAAVRAREFMEPRMEEPSESRSEAHSRPFEPTSNLPGEERRESRSGEKRSQSMELKPSASRDQDRSLQPFANERSFPSISAIKMPAAVTRVSPPEQPHLQGGEGPRRSPGTTAAGASSPVPLMRVHEDSLKAESLPLRLATTPGLDGNEAKRSEEPREPVSRLSLAPDKAGSQGAARQIVDAVKHLPQALPDEIHIHIGRIEVTAAAPQAAPRPGPVPLRKGPALGEYLKKGGRG